MSDDEDDYATDDRSPPPRRVSSTPLRRSPRLEAAAAVAAVAAAARRVSNSPIARPVRSARQPGRPKHAIWGFFGRITGGSSKPHAECNFCHDVIRNAQPGTNMQRHLKACSSAPVAVKQQIHDYFPDSRRESASGPASDADYTRATNSSAMHSATGVETAQAPTLTPAQQQQQFELALASMFYLCALPFVLVESESFRAPFKELVPGIRFPSRHRLSGELLQRARDQIRARAINLIRARKFVTVVTDGWTNVNHSTIINFMVVAPGMPSVFWSSLATGTAAETAKYLAGHLGRVIDEIERDTGAIVAGVLTDNASNMSGAWAILERSRPIFGGGCAAHVLNLLIQDMFALEDFKKVEKWALAITSYVRDHHAVLSQFQSMLAEIRSGHRRGLVVPVSTRWYSLHACLSRVLENKSVLKKLFTEPQYSALIQNSASSSAAKEKCRKVKKLIGDKQFWNKLEQVVGFVDPVIEALRELESDNCPCSRVYSRFQELLNHPAYGTDEQQSPLQSSIKAIVQYRWDYVHTNATGMAFLLSPHTDLNSFVDDDEADTRKQLLDFAESSGLVARTGKTRADFNGEASRFSATKRGWDAVAKREHEGEEPRDWWVNNQKNYPLMYEIAIRVFAIPTSSAASERAWSIMDFIHSKKRNRLSIEKVDMLAYIYVNHHAVEEADHAAAKKGVDWARLHCYPESHDALEAEEEEQIAV